MDAGIYDSNSHTVTKLDIFQRIIEGKYNVKFGTYWEFHNWSVQNYTKFLEEMWSFFNVISSQSYDQVLVKTGEEFLDNEWFSGAKLNYAENILCIRDNRIALICLDEQQNEEKISFAQMYEEVKLYAAAFRKNGLKPKDRVACYMSNRKEAVFAMLAAASIGAIFGGPLPFYGAKAASHTIAKMEPKFLITVDEHQNDGVIYPLLDYLPEIVKNVPSFHKVILVVTKEETKKKDLSSILPCIYLEDFLEAGKSPKGEVPDFIFEQLSFNHPRSISFTSGTSGSPKALVHSAGTFLSLLQDAAFLFDMKKGEVILTCSPVGWSVWDYFLPCLALGVTLVLFSGCAFYTENNFNFWNLIVQYKVKMVLMAASVVEKMEKMNIIPGPDADMSCLQIVLLSATPVKKNNMDFLDRIKKGVFKAIQYCATETFGAFASCNLKMPVHSVEIQVPALGMDLHCMDSNGVSKIGERGELVICSPTISFPIGIWKDYNKSKLTAAYLSKFPGMWTQHDEGWINPETRGILVLGRSDDTINQNVSRFGAADIYFAIHSLPELQDYICVSQRKSNGDSRAVLFIKLKNGLKLTPEIKEKIAVKVEKELWIDCVPELILDVPDIPLYRGLE